MAYMDGCGFQNNVAQGKQESQDSVLAAVGREMNRFWLLKREAKSWQL